MRREARARASGKAAAARMRSEARAAAQVWMIIHQPYNPNPNPSRAGVDGHLLDALLHRIAHLRDHPAGAPPACARAARHAGPERLWAHVGACCASRRRAGARRAAGAAAGSVPGQVLASPCCAPAADAWPGPAQACNVIQLLKSLSLYVATVLCGFGVHAFISLPLTLLLLSRLNPLSVVKAFIPAFAMGCAPGAAPAPLSDCASAPCRRHASVSASTASDACRSACPSSGVGQAAAHTQGGSAGSALTAPYT
jgi:hypothetical protein